MEKSKRTNKLHLWHPKRFSDAHRGHVVETLGLAGHNNGPATKRSLASQAAQATVASHAGFKTASKLDDELKALLDKRAEFLKEVRILWTNKEIRVAKKEAQVAEQRAQRILDLCKSSSQSLNELATELCVASTAIEDLCNQLCDLGMLERYNDHGLALYKRAE